MQDSENKAFEPVENAPDFDFDFDFGEDEAQEPSKEKEKRFEPSENSQDDTEQKPYFYGMYQKIAKDMSPKSVNLDSKKVLEELKAHHSENRTNREATTHSNILQDKIQDTLEELHRHEEEWKELHDLQHDINQKIADKEEEIEEQLESFKTLIRKLTYTKLSEDTHAFVLSDGHKIRSISQLITLLPTISDETFNSHVNPNKNDFAQWIDAVFNDGALADIVRKCSTRKDLYVALKKAINATSNA